LGAKSYVHVPINMLTLPLLLLLPLLPLLLLLLLLLLLRPGRLSRAVTR
jgi:hypothetical protein